MLLVILWINNQLSWDPKGLPDKCRLVERPGPLPSAADKGKAPAAAAAERDAGAGPGPQSLAVSALGTCDNPASPSAEPVSPCLGALQCKLIVLRAQSCAGLVLQALCCI